MRTDLDERMDRAIAALTGAGGPLAIGTIPRDGRALPVIATAPPTLPAYFAHFCHEHADKTFLVSGDERLSFAEVHTHAMQVARALVGGWGVARGDRVGIAGRNSPAWIVLYMGVVMAGGVATLLNAWWQRDELMAAIGEVRCRLVLADAPRGERLAGCSGTTVMTFDDSAPIEVAITPLLARSAATTLPTLTGDDAATILFTSGSTGKARGALSDHRAVVQATFNYLAQAMMMLALAIEDGTASDLQPATLLNLPLFHVTGEVPVMLQSLAMGRKLVLMAKWDAREAMRLIAAERVTYFVGVPLMSYEIVTHPDRGDYDLSSVTDFAAGGAPRPLDHVRRIAATLPGAPLIGYGLTETNAAGSGNWRSNYLAKPGSAGRASAPLIDLAILDDAGAPVPRGARGEVAIRSVCNFRAYWNAPEATAAAITADGYFRTGDIGYLDEDQYLFIVDRKKDVIIRGGENISCHEVEAALYAHPQVAEAAVFGIADDRYGEVPVAIVHLVDPDATDAAALADFLTARIAAFKIPQRIYIARAPLPRLGTEKIDRMRLRADYGTVDTG